MVAAVGFSKCELIGGGGLRGVSCFMGLSSPLGAFGRLLAKYAFVGSVSLEVTAIFFVDFC